MKPLSMMLLIFCSLAVVSERARADACADAETAKSKYLEVWQNLFLGANHVDADYFKAHVRVERTENICWQTGISLHVYYTVATDWAQAQAHDTFLILVHEPDGVIGAEKVPHETLLTENDIHQLARTYSPEFTRITAHEHLFYPTQKAAETAVEEHLHGKISSQSIAYYVPGKVPRTNGDPHLLFHSIKDSSGNVCVTGSLNLITGDIQATDTACVVN